MADSDYHYDVFISYSSDNKHWVTNWLLPHLEAAGLQVCIDHRDFDVGVASLKNIERALDNSRHTLAVLTPAWVASEWTELEVLLTQTGDPAARRRRVLPLVLKNCQPPQRIDMLTYADFRQQEDWEGQLERVVSAARGELRLSAVGPRLTELLPPASPFSEQEKVLVGHTNAFETAMDAGLTQALETGGLAALLTRIAMPMPPPDSPPLPPMLQAGRGHLVREVCDNLADTTWVALIGATGLGKTQLARSVVQACATKKDWWVSLRGQDGATACSHLEQQIARWLVRLTEDELLWDSYALGRISITRVIDLVAQRVGGDGLLIVDNLPDPLQDKVLYQHLGSAAAIFAAHGTKLLTTSQRGLPPVLQSDLGQLLSVTSPPAFSENDILEVLERAGAPPVMRKENTVALVFATTKGHPSLVMATVHWLKQRQWSLAKEDLTRLLAGEPTEGVREAERRRMLRLLNEESRELLYRVSLLRTEFDRKLALRIAAVPPQIPRPGENLDELVGPWLDRLERGQYEVVAILEDAGRLNLSEETRKQVHKVISEHFLSQGTIDVSRGHAISLHLWAAGDYRGFATLLTRLMLSAATPSQAQYLEWATYLLLPDIQWPVEIELDLRIMLRAAQVRTRVLAGGDAAELDADLRELMALAGPEDSLALLMAYLNTGPLLSGMAPEVALHRALQAVRLIRDSAHVSEEDFPEKLEELVWIPTLRLQEPEQIRQFLSEVRLMTDEERRRLFSADLAIEAVSHLMDRSWFAEAAKPAEQRDWDSVLDMLHEAEDIGALPGAHSLKIAQARAKALVLADYQDRRDAALKVLEAIPNPEEPDLLFLVNYTLGCVLFDDNQLAEALLRLDAAARTDGQAFSYYRFDAERRTAIAHAKLAQWDHAKKSGIKAIHLAAATPESLAYDRLEMIGELAWVHWATGNRRKACGAMYGLVNGLVAREDVTEARFRETFNKTGHALGWYGHMAERRSPPPATPSGEVYHAVEAGFFGIRRELLGEYVSPVGYSKAILLTQLGMFAGTLDLPCMAWRAYRLIDYSEEGEGGRLLLEAAKTDVALLAARFGHPEEAVAIGLRAARALVVSARLRERDADYLLSLASDDIRTTWESVPSEQRATAEQMILHLVLAAAFADWLADGLSKEEVDARLAEWEKAMSANREAFEDPNCWDKVVPFLKTLSSVWGGASVPEGDIEIPEDSSCLQILWYLVGSMQPETRLVDSLRMQVMALEYLVRIPDLGRHMLPGGGKFIHRFWLDAVNRRSFAVRSPRLFREELFGISPSQGAKTGVRVLRSASRALGVTLPENIATAFSQVEAAGA